MPSGRGSAAPPGCSIASLMSRPPAVAPGAGRVRGFPSALLGQGACLSVRRSTNPRNAQEGNGPDPRPIHLSVTSTTTGVLPPPCGGPSVHRSARCPPEGVVALGRPAEPGGTPCGRPRGPPTGQTRDAENPERGRIMRRLVIAPILGTLTLGFVVVA